MNTALDRLYFNGSIEILRQFAGDLPTQFVLADSDSQKALIDEIIASKNEIYKPLFENSSKSLQNAVETVMGKTQYGDKNFDLSQQFMANVNRFAAYRAYHLTEAVRRQQADENGVVRSDKDFYNSAKQVLNAANRYQAAEYHAAIVRSRTALQWQEFADSPEIPNLKWLPSLAAEPDKAHMKLYGIVLPKNHDFWRSNQPGNRWGCRCDWEETFDKADGGDLPQVKPAQGLEGNPAETGEIFTKKASYFNVDKGTGKMVNSFFIGRERRRIIESFERTNEKESHENLSSGVFLDSEKSFTKRLLHHVYGEKEIAAAAVLPYHIGEITDPKPSPLGEGKDMSLKKNVKNIKEKKRRGVVMYYKYKWTFAGKQYTVVMELHKNGFEQLYALVPKKK